MANDDLDTKIDAEAERLKQGAKDLIAKIRELEQRAVEMEKNQRWIIWTVITLSIVLICCNALLTLR